MNGLRRKSRLETIARLYLSSMTFLSVYLSVYLRAHVYLSFYIRPPVYLYVYIRLLLYFPVSTARDIDDFRCNFLFTILTSSNRHFQGRNSDEENEKVERLLDGGCSCGSEGGGGNGDG